ncbi:hypothetical protein QM716_15825 [Rhodococcus sp. IEGM 1409]|uniref:hypothetical protein n=1 Tax=Rhodococcus sp. IEGM 1409 TaxID=3047082 RepID=UPI0024B7410F|nr:hypothetical protein [Rhodococcus sp. IEGM 1409]MDI9901327.1 hypothetical protein [Rhodococcus sp. IEGM 1409]
MSGEVISINRKAPEPPTLICACGSGWFTALVCFDGQTVTGYSLPVKCIDCGQEVTP